MGKENKALLLRVGMDHNPLPPLGNAVATGASLAIYGAYLGADFAYRRFSKGGRTISRLEREHNQKTRKDGFEGPVDATVAIAEAGAVLLLDTVQSLRLKPKADIHSIVDLGNLGMDSCREADRLDQISAALGRGITKLQATAQGIGEKAHNGIAEITRAIGLYED